MSLWDQLKGLFNQAQAQMIHHPLPDERSDRPSDGAVAQAELHYFRFKIAQMFLKDKVKMLQTWYPAANSLVQCSFGGNNIELPNIADTSRMLAKQTGKGDIIAKNFLLTPLIPFKGGEVRLITGLFAVEGKNQMKELVNVMGGFAKLLAVPQLSTALSIAEPLASGIQALVSGGGMHLAFHNSFVGAGGTGTPLRSGYVAVIRSTDQAIRERLLVKGDELWTGASLTDPQARPYEDTDFLLLHVELRDARDDWNALGSIATPFKAAIDALGESDNAKADAHLRVALVAALKADELTKADRRRVVDAIKAEFAEAKNALTQSGAVETARFDFEQRMAAVSRAVPAKKALQLGEPTYADLAL